jgi:hypothetical protein
MDRTGKTLLVVWLSGVVFALVMTERWRRRGTSTLAVAAPVEAPPAVASPVAIEEVRSHLVRSVAAGAKADFAWVKHKVGRITA